MPMVCKKEKGENYEQRCKRGVASIRSWILFLFGTESKVRYDSF